MSSMPTHLQQLRDKLKCSFCTREFQNGLFTKCAVCENIMLCQDCFCAGVRLPGHNSSHPYRVSDCLENPVFAKDWSTREELILLDGIDKYGVGNWKTIADAVLPNKTTKQLEDHYWELYMGIYGYCLPQRCLVDNVLTDTKSLFPNPPVVDSNGKEAIDEKDHFHVPLYHGHDRGEIVQRDEGRETAVRTGTKEIRDRVAQLPGSDLPGFMPLREDFEIEYENDAEVPLADMEFYPDEHPNETALKLQVLRIYITKLAERDRRKRFAIDRGLIDIKLQQSKEKKLTKEERELVGRLRVFARFQSSEEHEALVRGVVVARRLRNQIELYKLYRQMGFKTLEDIRGYEAERKNKEMEAKIQKQRESAPHLYDLSSPAQPLTTSTMNGNTSSKSATGHGSASSQLSGGGEEIVENRPKRRGRPPAKQDDSHKQNTESKNTDTGERRSTRARIEKLDEVLIEDSHMTSGTTAGTSAEVVLTPADYAAMRAAPSGHLLNELEIELCLRLPMFPEHYLGIKEAIVREAFRNGTITKEGIRRTVWLDNASQEKIYDFFVSTIPLRKIPLPSKEEEDHKDKDEPYQVRSGLSRVSANAEGDEEVA